ncbi:hypothetical protein M378DRAFT_19316 [Amanita muscaria Koide BX008]|uniref:C2H2-type domain-containing protein n=1 Tax=Amanita muscaria (strain Koide BX008) TaxID=946122 RepID=A0A0C2RUV6_AMAMK|nr:hypothetical protein M378DRAFT_19316 [Amanita muscaria Koide BX008]
MAVGGPNDYLSTPLASENTNSTRFATAHSGGTAQGISESHLAALNHLMSVDEFMNNVGSCPLTAQQTPSHAHNGQADHPDNLALAVCNIQQAHKWRCNIGDCQHETDSKRDIQRHWSTLRHGGSRKYKCELCGKAFGRKDTLKRHVKDNCRSLRFASIANTV